MADLEALLRRWLGRAMAGVVLKDRVSLETGAVSRDDMVMALWRRACKSKEDGCLAIQSMQLEFEVGCRLDVEIGHSRTME